jgi:hypothetical protein
MCFKMLILNNININININLILNVNIKILMLTADSRDFYHLCYFLSFTILKFIDTHMYIINNQIF